VWQACREQEENEIGCKNLLTAALMYRVIQNGSSDLKLA
jgi:hypothetical protein